jgi:hypothetical protein
MLKMDNHEVELQEDIYLEGTDLLPSVIFMKEGSMRIEGRIVPDNVASFFAPLHQWVKNLRCSKVVFDVDIEYMNTNATAQLYHLLKALQDNQIVQHTIVFWHYEEEDEEHVETGRIMAEKLKCIKFFFKSYVR